MPSGQEARGLKWLSFLLMELPVSTEIHSKSNKALAEHDQLKDISVHAVTPC